MTLAIKCRKKAISEDSMAVFSSNAQW